MNRILSIFALTAMAVPAMAQQTLTLDSCRAMALGNNKTLTASKVQRTMAEQTRKAARTKYLPHLDVIGGAIFSSKEISILNNTQKSTLNNIGTNLGGMLGVTDPRVTGALDKIGQGVTDAFRTNNGHADAACIYGRCHHGGQPHGGHRRDDGSQQGGGKQTGYPA